MMENKEMVILERSNGFYGGYETARDGYELQFNTMNIGTLFSAIQHGLKRGCTLRLLDRSHEEEFMKSLTAKKQEPETVKPDNILFVLDDLKVSVTAEDVDDIMESAMTGAVYWCREAVVTSSYLGEYASEQISRGGALSFIPFEGRKGTLDLERFKKGLHMYLKNHEESSRCICDGKVDPGQIDSVAADCIIQYAMFGDIIYA